LTPYLLSIANMVTAVISMTTRTQNAKADTPIVIISLLLPERAIESTNKNIVTFFQQSINYQVVMLLI